MHNKINPADRYTPADFFVMRNNKLTSIIFILLLAIILTDCGEKIITNDTAIKIATKKAKTESFVNKIIFEKVTTKYNEDKNDYFVDFAFDNASEITPGQWSNGYYVVVNAKNGNIKDATAYKR